jgi:hypothetical protein
MSKLIILTTIALERPDRSVACEFFYCKDEDVSTKIKEIKDRVINECIEAWQEGTGEPIGNCKFKDGYVKGLKSKSNFAKNLDLTNDVFFVDNDNSYLFAYAISVRDLEKNNKLTIFNF